VDFSAPGHALEQADSWLSGALPGAPLLLVLALACLLGLRHATDPDHLVAVTALVAGEERASRRAMRLGAWWGVGHAGTLLLVGLPLLLIDTQPPGWLELGAEKAVGVVMIVLALRLLLRWARGDLRMDGAAGDAPARAPRSGREALAIGVLHGVAGTGAVVLLLVATIPSRPDAALALLAFAPMSVLSMMICTGGFAWTFTRSAAAPVCNLLMIPALGAFGILFGTWYAGML
jgi:hypothetical protein